MNLSHIDLEEVTNMLDGINKKYGKTRIIQGKKHDSLKMNLY